MELRSFREESEAFADRRRFSEDFILPDYDKFCNKNISSVIGDAFNVSPLVSAKFPKEYLDDLNGISKVILIVVDGLGYNRLLSHMEKFEGTFFSLAEKGVLKPITSTFPATTSTSLTSIFTALPPSDHGIIGYLMYLKNYGLVLDTLNMKPVYGWASDAKFTDELTPRVKTWRSSLSECGIKVLTATKGIQMDSGLSKVLHTGQEMIPYLLSSDMITSCRKALEQPGPTLTVMYYAGLDALEHLYGPSSEEATLEIRSLEYLIRTAFLDKLPKTVKEETLFLLTADHGQSETSEVYFLRDIPEVRDRLIIPPVGDSRAMFLFPKNYEDERLREAFEKNIEGFRLVSSKELIKKGAFGPTENQSKLEEKVGSMIALGTGDRAILYPYSEKDREKSKRGSHGGMSVNEMIVPLLSLNLSKL